METVFQVKSPMNWRVTYQLIWNKDWERVMHSEYYDVSVLGTRRMGGIVW